MKIFRDRIFGKVEIKDSFIEELLDSYEMKRLGGVDQSGYFQPFHPNTEHSRLEHSLGVYFLLDKFSDQCMEKVAGLIHDISHTTFSHCIDYILNKKNTEKQDFQDSVFYKYLTKSSIPEIMKKYGYNVKDFKHIEQYELLERDLPYLCADRIDYSLRGFMVFLKIDRKKILDLLDNFMIMDRKWVFKDKEKAFQYADWFYKLNNYYYSAKETAAMFKYLKEYLEHALENKYIKKSDFFLTDHEVLKKINKNIFHDKILMLKFQKLKAGDAAVDKKRQIRNKVVVKSRIVDPLFIERGKIKKISDAFPEWKKVLKNEIKPKIHFIL